MVGSPYYYEGITMEDEKNLPHVLMSGNPVDGFTLTGPYKDYDEVFDANQDNYDGDWWLIPIRPIKEG